MADIDKHRKESIDVAFSFTNQLDSGDGLSTVDSISITKQGGHTDLSSEFGSPTGTINGDDAEVTFGVAAAGDQDGGPYQILIEVTTTGGDQLVHKAKSSGKVPTLHVSEEGDPDAP